MRFSAHAITRFREQSGSKKSETKVENRLIKMFMHACEVRPRSNHVFDALLNHKASTIKYYRFSSWIFVVDGDMILTVYQSDNRRWEQK